MTRWPVHVFSLFCVVALPLLGGATATANSTDGETLRLAQDGQTDYVIVLRKPATPSETFAVAELQKYLQKATGARFAVADESNLSVNARGIYVGWTEFAIKHGIDSSKLDEQEWVIQTVGKDLVLMGGRPVGSLYAVYEFLENNVGCRWLDRDTEIVPRRPDLTISKLNIRAKPAFRYRSIETGLSALGLPSEMLAKEGLFQQRNKSTDWLAKFGHVPPGSPGPHHTFYAYSLNFFPADHPEYFSMNAAGERQRATSGVGPGQLCLTNPEVRRLLLARLKMFIAQDRQRAAKSGRPWPQIYDISQNDNDSFCVCPACKALAAKEGSQSGSVIDCINEVADGIRDEYPDVLIRTFAYSSALKPPKTIKPRDNVIIRLAQPNGEWFPGDAAAHCADYFRPMSHPVNRAVYENLLAWAKLAKHLSIWDYWVMYPVVGAFPTPYFPTPYVNVACLQPNLQLYSRNHVEDFYVECEDPDRALSFSALKLWLGQKLLQDPNQPVEPLLKSFMEGYYGPAAPQMTEYLRYMEKRIAATPETKNLSSTPAGCVRPYLDLEFFTTAYRLLTEAEQACKAETNALAHVRQEWIPVDAAIYNMWLSLERQLPKGRKMPLDRSAILRHYADVRSAVLKQFYYGSIPAKITSGMEDDLKRYGELPALERKAAAARPQ